MPDPLWENVQASVGIWNTHPQPYDGFYKFRIEVRLPDDQLIVCQFGVEEEEYNDPVTYRRTLDVMILTLDADIRAYMTMKRLEAM